ncbi:MAG TPA: transposase [Blastocatellia bacterium]|nr:transposase [Blastocatellia bacterium]
MTTVIQNQKQKVMAINGMPDHVHLLIGMSPDIALSDLVKDVKVASSSLINDKRWVRGHFRWQRGFGAFSHSRSQVSTVAKYIENQERHHAGECVACASIDRWPLRGPGECVAGASIDRWPLRGPGEYVGCASIDRWALRGPGECVACASIDRWALRGPCECVACASIDGWPLRGRGECVARASIDRWPLCGPGECVARASIDRWPLCGFG